MLFSRRRVYAPNVEKYVAAGVSVRKEEQNGQLKIFDKKTLQLVNTVQMNSSAVRCMWAPNLNQIFVGAGDGTVQSTFD
jgi:WD repeat-containing protein 70